MKGPGLRIDLDVRRVWQCPKCGRQMRCSGDVTSRVCNCQKEETMMLLVEETKPAPPRADCRGIVPASGPIQGENEAPGSGPASDQQFGSGISSAADAPEAELPGRLPEADLGEKPDR